MDFKDRAFLVVAFLVALIAVGGIVWGGVTFILGDNFGALTAMVTGFLGFAFYNVYLDRKEAQRKRALETV